LPGDLDASKVFTTDTGPGNTLLDAITRKFYPEMEYDEDGKIALAGQVHESLLLALKDHPFFEAPFPKTTGPEVFNLAYLAAAQEKTNTADLSAPDSLRTLVQFSADTIVGDQTGHWRPNFCFLPQWRWRTQSGFDGCNPRTFSRGKF